MNLRRISLCVAIAGLALPIAWATNQQLVGVAPAAEVLPDAAGASPEDQAGARPGEAVPVDVVDEAAGTHLQKAPQTLDLTGSPPASTARLRSLLEEGDVYRALKVAEELALSAPTPR